MLSYVFEWHLAYFRTKNWIWVRINSKFRISVQIWVNNEESVKWLPKEAANSSDNTFKSYWQWHKNAYRVEIYRSVCCRQVGPQKIRRPIYDLMRLPPLVVCSILTASPSLFEAFLVKDKRVKFFRKWTMWEIFRGLSEFRDWDTLENWNMTKEWFRSPQVLH